MWFHARPFRPESYAYDAAAETPPPDPGLCVDVEARCAEWAASGECAKNPGYMLGAAASPGMCRRSCRACEPCDGPDDASGCYATNRRAAGYLVLDDAELEATGIGGVLAAAKARQKS